MSAVVELANSLRLVPGRVVLGKYQVLRVLGAGGMGVVVAARQIDQEKVVALKFLKTVHSTSVHRFLREARAAIQLRSEHVARVFEVGRLETGEPVLVMEYLDGESVAHLLRRAGALSIRNAVRCAFETCVALEEAHQLGVIHRDVKPSNLFLARESTGVSLKLLDFGASKIDTPDEPTLTQSDMVIGSPMFASPEQLTQPKSVDSRVDVWGVGVSLYAMLAGDSPFTAETTATAYMRVLSETPTPLHKLRADIPMEISQVVKRCLAKTPADRYPTIGELKEALKPFAHESLDLDVISERYPLQDSQSLVETATHTHKSIIISETVESLIPHGLLAADPRAAADTPPKAAAAPSVLDTQVSPIQKKRRWITVTTIALVTVMVGVAASAGVYHRAPAPTNSSSTSSESGQRLGDLEGDTNNRGDQPKESVGDPKIATPQAESTAATTPPIPTPTASLSTTKRPSVLKWTNNKNPRPIPSVDSRSYP